MVVQGNKQSHMGAASASPLEIGNVGMKIE
jgi:hypothetical protein